MGDRPHSALSPVFTALFLLLSTGKCLQNRSIRVKVKHSVECLSPSTLNFQPSTCLRLRVKDVGLARLQVIVRAGKGDKDRVTMLAVQVSVLTIDTTATPPALEAAFVGAP